MLDAATALALRLIALKALGEQRLKIDADIRAKYRHRDLIDKQIAEYQHGISGPIECDEFVIKPRTSVARKFTQLSPSQRRRARAKADMAEIA